MFKKRYIFETKATLSKRRAFQLFFILLSTLIVYGLFCFVILHVAYNEQKKAEEAFFERAPDLIVIFTGDSGRIPLGLQKALDYRLPHVFITGVYNPNSLRTILDRQGKHLPKEIDFNRYFIDIDYQARNTIENVLSMIKYLRQNSSVKKVLIVSSDYHIVRIKMILHMLTSSHDPYQFYFMHPITDYQNSRNIKILLKEVFKSFKAFLFLMLWDYEQQI